MWPTINRHLKMTPKTHGNRLLYSVKENLITVRYMDRYLQCICSPDINADFNNCILWRFALKH